MTATDWALQPLAEVQKALRDGRLTARALTDAAIARHDKFGAKLNAYRTWDPEAARRQAALADAAFAAGRDLGPLQGIPVSVKDLYGVPGMPTFAGSPKRLPGDYEQPGPAVQALIHQLAVIMGKTHTVEFAFGGLGTNPHWGAPWNPWDAKDHRAPGGSSSGAGVSLIEGSAFLALGTDTGGSVRSPASMTGTVGVKTTKGRWPTDGIVSLSTTLDTAGVLARTAADAAIGFAAIDGSISGQAPTVRRRPLSSLRFATTKDHFWERCTPTVAQVVRATLADIGGGTEIDFSEAARASAAQAEGGIIPSELKAELTARLPEWIPTLDPHVAMRMNDSPTPADAYVRVVRRLQELGAAARAKLEDFDALLVPMVPLTPPKIADVAEWETYRRDNGLALSNANIINGLGLCAISLPIGLDDAKMPVGLQLVGTREETLLSVALALEDKLGTSAARLGTAPMVRG